MAKSKSSTGMTLDNVQPRTANQRRMFEEWDDGKHIIVTGYAGTGKSLLGIFLGLSEIEIGNQSALTVVRAPIATSDIGFLPGTKAEKESVLKDPYIGLCKELYNRGDAFEVLEKKGIIEFTTTSYIRGITLSNRTVLIDEAQNLNEHGFDSILTRLGQNSRLIICGDTGQCDLTRERSGLSKTIEILEHMGSVAHIKMTPEDILRSGFVKDYILAKEEVNGFRSSAKAQDASNGVQFLNRVVA